MVGQLVDERGIEPHVNLIDKAERMDGIFSREPTSHSIFGYRMSIVWFLVVAGLATLLLLRTRMSDPAATLSGGQKQAGAIARAIVYGSRCLILDEPTAALAARQTQQVLDQVRRAREAG